MRRLLVIGICDADTAVRALLTGFIKRYRQEYGAHIQVLSYDAGEKLLRHYPMEMDLLFLEIPFARLNGIEIARRVRQADPHVGIVFLTSLLSHVLEAYEVRADNYVLKPLKYEKFVQEIERARLKRGHHRFFLEKTPGALHKVYVKSIRFIETTPGGTRIHTEAGLIESKHPMKQHEAFLFESFFVRCHAGFLINLYFFDRLEEKDLVLLDGQRIPVSRHRRSLLVERLTQLPMEGEDGP